MRTMAIVIAATASLALAACGKPAETPADTGAGADSGTSGNAAPAPEAPTGPSLADAPAGFSKCVACHAIKPGVNAVGPSLFGVFGKKAASVPGYAYSDALKAKGITWDEASLDTWLAAPMKDVPGTKMAYAGTVDPAERKAVIEFLKTLK